MKGKAKEILWAMAGLLVGVVILNDVLNSRLEGKQERTVSVTGECFLRVPRDQSSITLRVRTLDKNAAVSLRNAQRAADEVVRLIRTIDDDTLEIQTQRITSQERHNWTNNSSILVGIESEVSLEIRTHNSESINAVLNTAQAIRGAEVFPERMRNFSSRAIISETKARCLEIAMTDAREKAGAALMAEGKRLGRLVSARIHDARVDSSSNTDFMPLARAGAVMVESMDMGGGDHVQSSDGDLSVSIGAVFDIR